MDIDAIAPKLNGAKEGTFAYITIKDRWTQILAKTIDHLHCNRRVILGENYDEDNNDSEEDESSGTYGWAPQDENRPPTDDVQLAIAELSGMRYKIMTDKPLEDLTDGGPEIQMWNTLLMEIRDEKGADAVTWYKHDWLFNECYFYRRIYGALFKTALLKTYDVFAEQKKEGFQLHTTQIKNAIDVLASLLSEVDLKQNSLEILLKTCLWGNRCDLSLTCGEASVYEQSVEEVREKDSFLLVDDIGRVIDHIIACARKPNVRIDIILDNAGMELVGDLILAEYLISAGLAQKIVFHCKEYPWFVSDVTAVDWAWTLEAMADLGELTAAFVKGVRERINKGQFELRSDPFWTSPFAYFEMEQRAPELYKDLGKSSLVVFKGDLNYRKLTGDRDWDHEKSFHKALRGFRPAPLVALRTLKAETVVGLTSQVVDNLMATFGDSNSWLVSGDYAVVQAVLYSVHP